MPSGFAGDQTAKKPSIAAINTLYRSVAKTRSAVMVQKINGRVVTVFPNDRAMDTLLWRGA